MQRYAVIALAAFSLTVCTVQVSLADPLDGQVLKFLQLPLNGGVIPPGVPLPPDPIPPAPAPFPGHDEFSTAYRDTSGQLVYRGRFMADDFADKFSTPVVHVQWWGSYLDQFQPTNLVQKFLISFETDVPATPTSFSRPGVPILNQVVTRGALAPGSGTFTEVPVLPPAPGSIELMFQYNAELAIPFQQDPDIVYWLKIVALEDRPIEDPQAIRWGWHNRDWGVHNPLAGTPAVGPGEFDENPVVGGPPMWHFQDDAVTGFVDISQVPGTTQIQVLQTEFAPQFYIPGLDMPTFYPQNISKDLAFALYTIPEPGTMLLLGIGGVALVWHGVRRRRRA